jgi:hypothetical protein
VCLGNVLILKRGITVLRKGVPPKIQGGLVQHGN